MQEAEPTATPALQRFLFERDHTRGSVLASLAVLALPALLMGLAGGAAYQAIELWFVGQLGRASMAAFGVAAQSLGQVPFLAGFGISVVSQMLVSQHYGAGRPDDGAHVAGQALVLGAGVSAVIALGALFPHELLGLITNDAEVIAAGAPYVRVAYGLMFAQLFGMLFSFLLSGAGETTTPLLISLISTPLTILLEWLLVLGHFGFPALGLLGIALGVSLASLVSLAIALTMLLTGRCRLHLRLRHLRPDRALLGRIARDAWQPAVHLIVPTSIMIALMTLAGRYGTDVQAGYTIGLRVETLPVFLALPVANACATLVGQNLGAGRPERAWRAIRVGYAVELVAMALVALGLFAARGWIVAQFTTDPEVTAVAREYLVFACANVVLLGVYFVTFRALQGAGDMRTPMLASLAAALFVALPLGWLLVEHLELGPRALWITNLAFSTTNTALAVASLVFGRQVPRRAAAP
jgi:putative MATE family efflux protein